MSNVTSGKAAAVRWSRPLALVLLCVLLTSCTRTKTPPALAPDWILHHGKVFTVDRDFRIAQAVAVKDDEFVAVGSDEEVLALAGDRTRLMDLEGKAVLPGIIDSHVHALSYGLNASRLTFAVTPVIHTVESMLQVVKTKAQAAPKGSWIAGRGPFSLDFVREGRLPTRWELDQVAPDHPVYINMQGHVGLANSLALKLAGITRNTPDPKGGKIVRDPKSGEPNGLLLEEFAWGPVARLLPQFGRSDLVEAVRTANRLFNEAGITSVVDPDGGVEESRDKMDALEEVWRNKEMTARWHVLYRFRGTAFADKTDAEIAAAVRSLGPGSRFGDEWLRVGGIKLSLDGFVEGAYMRQPYGEELYGKGWRGIIRGWTPQSLRAVLRAARRHGFQMYVHAIGDAALDMALDAIDQIHTANSVAAERWTLEHAGVLPDARQQELVKKLGLIPATQQAMAWAAAPSLRKSWGDKPARNLFPNRTWLRVGVRVKGGSDVAPIDPFLGMYAYITRKDVGGQVNDPGEALTREETIRLYTINGAYGLFEEDRKGSIEAGKLADLVVLSANPLTVPEEEIKRIKPVTTMVGGRIVYEKKLLPGGEDGGR